MNLILVIYITYYDSIMEEWIRLWRILVIGSAGDDADSAVKHGGALGLG